MLAGQKTIYWYIRVYMCENVMRYLLILLVKGCDFNCVCGCSMPLRIYIWEGTVWKKGFKMLNLSALDSNCFCVGQVWAADKRHGNVEFSMVGKLIRSELAVESISMAVLSGIEILWVYANECLLEKKMKQLF